MSRDARLLEEYERRHGPPSARYRAIADAHGISESGVRGMISRARTARRQLATPEAGQPGNVIRLHADALTVDAALTLDDLDDTLRWQVALAALLKRKRYVRVEHLCDIHFPFHDPAIMAADYHRIGLTQPDIIVVGSDQEDNPGISRYVEEGSEEPEIGDFLDVMARYRAAHTRRLQEIAPDALLVNIEGNHGWPRFVKWGNRNNRHAAKLSDRRRYIENVRCDGAVMWIGSKQSVVIGSLLVEHGKLHNKHTAFANMTKRNFRYRGQMSGHTHRPQLYAVGGNVSAVSGCRCILPEPYADDEGDDYSAHMHGATVATVDTLTGAVDIQLIIYHKHSDHVTYMMGGQVYEVSAPPVDAKARAA